ncbi:MAG TPA: NADP-dependent malic enzyme [Candidatus Nitrosocosmicus sp.]|nr:NADP-dependent malic enzyme [Candidatus Nitrosocosmicus sp.]
MSLEEDAINLHRTLKGKIEIHNTVAINKSFKGKNDLLDLIYTPGVAFVARDIGKDKKLAFDYTSKWNNVAIVCDGTRVLGLGNVGPEAAIPVMEGKSVLFKVLGGVNAFPLCIDTKDKDEIIKLIKFIQPMFGAINIEDMESPKVLEIVERLQNELLIPVFHDDQHGTAIIALAGLLNALKLVDKKIDKVRVVIAGAGSAGYGIFKILMEAGFKDIIVTDSIGALHVNRTAGMENPYKREISKQSNPMGISGSLTKVIKGADVFIGVSGKGKLINKDIIKTMNPNPIVFGLSNPDPEILPSDALEGGARIVATGRSDFANQINNAVVFPSILRALLDLRINTLSQGMLVAVATAISNILDNKQLKSDYIIPRVDDPRIIHIVTDTLRNAIQCHIENKTETII